MKTVKTTIECGECGATAPRVMDELGKVLAPDGWNKSPDGFRRCGACVSKSFEKYKAEKAKLADELRAKIRAGEKDVFGGVSADDLRRATSLSGAMLDVALDHMERPDARKFYKFYEHAIC